MAVIKIVPMPGAEGQKGETGDTGAQGPIGATGATGPAGADAVWYYNGEYNIGASYVVGDVVTYDGQLWYRKNANGGNVGDTPSEGPFWDLIAAKGEDFNFEYTFGVFLNNSSIQIGPNAPETIAGNTYGWSIPFNYEVGSQNISYSLPTRKITLLNPGVYSISFSAQFAKNSHTESDVTIWMQEESPLSNYRLPNTTKVYRIKEDYDVINYENVIKVDSNNYEFRIMMYSPHEGHLWNIEANTVSGTGNPSSGSVLLRINKIGN